MNTHKLIIFLLLIQKNKENLCTTVVYSYKESDIALTDDSEGSCISTPDCWLDVSRHPEGPATGQHDQGSVNVKMAVPGAWMFSVVSVTCCQVEVSVTS